LKIIVSHDVDHLKWSEHFFRDLYVPKLWARSFKLLLTGVIDMHTFFSRINCWSNSRINRLEEVMALEKSLGIPATYFFVMRPGLGVAYKPAEAAPVIRQVIDAGFNAGVHGMAFNDLPAMKEEFETFRSISGLSSFGIRMHYLRSDENTRQKLSQAGYAFDSTEYAITAPYKTGNMMEFPISVMDVYCVRPEHRNMDNAKAYTISKLDEAEQAGIGYFTINFHDMLFDPAYKLYMDWFTWVINLCRERGHTFTSFEKAMAAYENNKV